LLNVEVIMVEEDAVGEEIGIEVVIMVVVILEGIITGDMQRLPT
jgi:hypothetical protein